MSESLHAVVLTHLEEYVKNQNAKIEEYQHQIKALELQHKNLGDSRLNIHAKKEIQNKIQSLSDKLKNLKSGDAVNKECQKSIQYLMPSSSYVSKMSSKQGKNVYSGRINPTALLPSETGGLECTRNKSMMLDEYKQNKTGASSSVYVLPYMKCSQCGIHMHKLIDASVMVCPECGLSSKYLDSSSKSLGYNDEIEYVTFSYKRQNHFQEWLNSFQARENTVIPDETIQSIMQTLFEMGITKTEEITRLSIRTALKKLRMRKYYDNITSIYCRITGKRPIRLRPELEELLKLMFMMIQRPFNKHCPATRKNFLSYSDILYKFFEILGQRKYLPYFSLLKGREKRFKFDQIWEPICKDLNWPFIPSI